MKIVYMGTPDFSVPALRSLVEVGHELAAVVTQPDRPKGRGKNMQFTPVKEAALSYGIPVYQPIKVRDEQFISEMEKLDPDVIVVAAFGQILPKRLLELPDYGCINIHASLLPKYRGAAPIQWAIIDGEKVTGVTTMRMDAGLDTGDIIDKTEVKIEETDTGGSLHDKLAEAGAELIHVTLEKLALGKAVFTKQDEEASCYAGKLTKELGRMDFTRSAQELERLIRGLNPWPGTYTYYKGRLLKIWGAGLPPEDGGNGAQAAPGEIISAEKDAILVKTGSGILAVTEVQAEGKRRMKTEDFLRGCPVESGVILG